MEQTGLQTTQNRQAQTLQTSQQDWQQLYPAITARADTPSALITSAQVPQVCQLGKDANGQMVGVTVFQIQIALLAAFMGSNWSEMQVHRCGELAYEKCYWFSLAELKQFINRIETGTYSSHKNFTPAVFMEFLNEYAEERMAERYDHYSQQKPVRHNPVTLSIEKMQGISLNRAQRICRYLAWEHEQRMNLMRTQLAEITGKMTAPTEITDEEYREFRAGYNASQMRKNIDSLNEKIKIIVE